MTLRRAGAYHASMDGNDERELFIADGVHASTGAYLLEPQTPDELAELATQGVRDKDAEELELLRARNDRDGGVAFPVAEGIDRGDLAQTGWGVIFAAVRPDTPEAAAQAEVRKALEPLLQHRKAQAGRDVAKYYQEFVGPRGYYPGDTNQKFLARLKVDAGAPADPEAMPYYLLIVGSPTEIPFSFQYQLDVTYAVGRIHFDTAEEYARYARAVVAAETEAPRRGKEVAFFAVRNPDDGATKLSREQLVEPLANALEANKRLPGWSYKRHYDDRASKATLGGLMGGAQTPALLFTASHGIAFDRGDPLQVRRQGALICSDWQNPRPYVPVAESMYFSGDDLGASADARGMIVFNFACYSGGTPEFNEYAKKDNVVDRRIAERPFVSGLHRGLLTHGALACVGHIERAWSESLPTAAAGNRLIVFRSAMEVLMKGLPIGAALEYFNARYAQLGADMSSTLESLDFASGDEARTIKADVARKWTAHNDARDYVVTGDPAVRLRFA